MPNFVAIPGSSDDPRSLRTRDALAGALIALMQERGYNEISVQDICERAAVGRSTFYAHFADKDEMFIRHTVVFARMMGEQLVWDVARESYQFPAAYMFDHVRQMRRVFESLASARMLEFILKVWQRNLAEIFVQRVRGARNGAKAAVPAEILAYQLAGSLITLITWWMDHHYPHDAAQMDAHFHHLVAGLR
ncbi:MAG: TetR/AcrR family transcriptional regulator [Povalibacter sp.]